MTTKQILFSVLVLGSIANNASSMEREANETQYFDNGKEALIEGELVANILFTSNEGYRNDEEQDKIEIIRYYSGNRYRYDTGEYGNGKPFYKHEGTAKEFKKMSEAPLGTISNPHLTIKPDGTMELTSVDITLNKDWKRFNQFKQAIELNNAAFCPKTKRIIYSPCDPLPRDNDLCAQYHSQKKSVQ